MRVRLQCLSVGGGQFNVIDLTNDSSAHTAAVHCSTGAPEMGGASVGGASIGEGVDCDAGMTMKTMEPVSAVVEKLLRKVTTEPPSIRHFFKPKQLCISQNTNDTAAEQDEKRACCDDGDDDDDDDDDDDAWKRNSCKAEPTKSANFLALRTVNDALPGKRPNCSAKQPASKKPKQSNIQALFLSAARNPQKKPTSSMQCPICNRVFDPAVSNADVNEHIDNCLIE